MPRAAFELATPATKRPQTALHRVATGIGFIFSSHLHKMGGGDGAFWQGLYRKKGKKMGGRETEKDEM
jgi:hypothetical protein